MAESHVTGPWIVDKTDNGDGTVEVSASVNVADMASLSVIDHTSEGVPIIGIRSPQDLATVCGVPRDYVLEWFRPNTWPIQTRAAQFGGLPKQAVLVLARQARGTFRAPTAAVESTRALIEQLKKCSPHRKHRRYPLHPHLSNVHPLISKGNANMLEISIPDLHYGMNVWNEQTGYSNYSMDIASRLFMGAIESLLQLARGHNYEYILFPIGNDYLHIDNAAHTTTKGTPQADATEWAHAFTRGRDLLITGIDRLKRVAPVKVITVPGNHDRDSSLHMAMIIDAYYNNDKNVDVDASPNPIKYHQYGKNLIGFDHGRNVPPSRYAGIMAEDQPQAWANSKFREWHLGDRHRKGGAWFQELTVGIEYLPSLCGINTWHRSKSYTWQRAATAFVWSAQHGPVLRLQVNVDPDSPEELLKP